jgi:Tol biopolymer transport system component
MVARTHGRSADGKTLATAIEDVEQATVKIALFELGSSGPPRMLDAKHYKLGVQFTPDGKSAAYAIRENGVDNVWVQPLDGSPGHLITDFKSEQIWSVSLSPDGERLAFCGVTTILMLFFCKNPSPKAVSTNSCLRWTTLISS